MFVSASPVTAIEDLALRRVEEEASREAKPICLELGCG
jgi:hypothetical protein